MPTKGREGHDAGKPEGVIAHASLQQSSEQPGYETQDINVSGVVTFLAGLAGCLVVFFVFCFFMGKAINYALEKQDGERDQWQRTENRMGETPRGAKREDMASNVEIEQRQLSAVVQTFPEPRLENDDGFQGTADLHAREDLLLENYSTSKDLPAGVVRIPIDQAMALVVQRGLPRASTMATTKPTMVGEDAYLIQAPLTTGFARTGYELQQRKAREEKLGAEAVEK